MNAIPFQQLTCPLDKRPLTLDGATWQCSEGHSFDVAKQGYVNLLPVQNKRSRDPGDHKEMVAARQRFLNAGHYQPIAELVSRTLLTTHQSSNPISCLDAGCGEGYYLRQLAEQADGQALSLMGLDISKWAVMAASRLDKSLRQSSWAVGSNANLPVESNSLDCVLCLFGFPVYPEFSRVLKPGGSVLLVNSGADHLRELRDLIYPNQKTASSNPVSATEGFTHTGSESVRFVVHLNHSEAISDLLAMTPHNYRAPPEGREKALQLSTLTVTADVQLNQFTLQC